MEGEWEAVVNLLTKLCKEYNAIATDHMKDGSFDLSSMVLKESRRKADECLTVCNQIYHTDETSSIAQSLLIPILKLQSFLEQRREDFEAAFGYLAEVSV